MDETSVLARANSVLPLYEKLKFIPPEVSLCVLFLFIANVFVGLGVDCLLVVCN